MRILRPVLTIVFVGAALGYIVAQIRGQWKELSDHDWDVRWAWTLVSGVAIWIWFVLRARMWQLAVVYFGETLSLRQAMRIWALSELGRYLPGKLWHVFGRLHLAGSVNVRPSAALAGMVLEMAIVIVVAGVLLLGSAVSLIEKTSLHLAFLAFAVSVLISAGHPIVLTSLINWALRRLGKPPIAERLTHVQLLKLFGLCCAAWLAHAVAFVVFAMSVWRIDVAAFFPLVGSYCAGWLTGLATPLAPGGIGVRESVLAVLLTESVARAGALAIAVSSRVWTMIAELLFVVAAVAFSRSAE